MADDFTIRPAVHADIAAVAGLAGELVRQHHGYDPARFFIPDRLEEGYAWWFGREIVRDDVVLVVAERAGVIVGYAYGRLEERDWNQLLDSCGALHDIFVDASERRRGVARALAERVFHDLAAKGAPRVVLHTAAANEGAQRFFEGLGFRRTMIEMTREA
jgi:ribosomal protein S18 acetylase RimI-like enzyme